jgi:hypothetical protein
MNDLVLRGSAEELRTQVLHYMDAGVDTAFLQLHSFETDPVKKRESALRVLRALAPGK